jgi:hypothetical protein
MTQLERKEKIDQNNKLIKELLNPSEFTLNNTISNLLKENAELQSGCEHSFVEGFCEYCYLQEEK